MNEGRRNVVFGLAGAPIWIPATGYQELIASVKDALYQRSPVPGDKDLKYLEQKIRYYWQDRYNATIAPSDLVAHVGTYVEEVTALLYHSLLPSIRTRLSACLSQGMLLIGVNFYDAGQFQTARACFQTALEAAHEANHNILQALAWNWDSYLWVYSNETGWNEHARGSMLKACHFASLESDLAVRCSSQAGLADVYAYLHEKEACLEALKQASQLGGYGPGDFYHIHQFDNSHLNGYRGFCLQQFDRLGDPDADSLLKEAKWAIEEALSQPNIAPLQRAFYVGDMAQLHARKGEVESACDRVRQIISIADASVALRHKLLTARTLLEPYADVQAVKDLDAEIKVFQLQ
jgi:hypothetical protein